MDPSSQIHQGIGGHVGLEVTLEPPHAVVAVQDLLDPNFVRQGMPGYSNEYVLPGDRILEVDGNDAESISVAELRNLLKGAIYSSCELVLARAQDGLWEGGALSERSRDVHVFSVQVLRHRYHEFDVMDGVNSVEQLDAPIVEHAHQRAVRSAAPAPRMPKSQTQSEKVDAVCACVMEGHDDMIYCSKFSQADGGGRWVLSSSADQTLRVWDIKNNVCYRTLQGHVGAVWSCSWSSRDGGKRWALSASRDKTCRIFDIESGEEFLVLEGHAGSVYACEYSVGASDSAWALTGSADKTLRVWNAGTGACAQVLEGHAASICCCAWSSADGGARWVLSGSDDESLRIWDLGQSKNTLVLEGHTGPVLCCCWSLAAGGRKWAISGSWDKTLKMWDGDTGIVAKTLSGHSAPVYSCSWSGADDARWLVSGSYDESLRLWDVSTGTCQRLLLGHTRWVRCCSWSNADGGKRLVVSGSRDKTLRVWELEWNDDFMASVQPLSPVADARESFDRASPVVTVQHTVPLQRATRAVPNAALSLPPPKPDDTTIIEIQRLRAEHEHEIVRLKVELETEQQKGAELQHALSEAGQNLATEIVKNQQIEASANWQISDARAEVEACKTRFASEMEELERLRTTVVALEHENKARYQEATRGAEEILKKAQDEASNITAEAEEAANTLLARAMKDIGANNQEAESAKRAAHEKLMAAEAMERQAEASVREMEGRMKQAIQASQIATEAKESLNAQLMDAIVQIRQLKSSADASELKYEVASTKIREMEACKTSTVRDAERQLSESLRKNADLEALVARLQDDKRDSASRVDEFVLLAETQLKTVEDCVLDFRIWFLQQQNLILDADMAGIDKSDTVVDDPDRVRKLEHGVGKYLSSIQSMVTRLQRDMEVIDSSEFAVEKEIITGTKGVKTGQQVPCSLEEPASDEALASKPNIVRASAPAIVRYAPPPQAASPLRSPAKEGGFIGLQVTTARPHAVVWVEDLVDEHFVRHDAPAYANPPVSPGDRILMVDDVPVENVTVEALRSMLRGRLHTPVRISLVRLCDENPYSITVLRHKFHAFLDEPPSTTSVKEIPTPSARLATRAAPLPTRAAPPSSSSSPPAPISAEVSAPTSAPAGAPAGTLEGTKGKFPAGAVLMAVNIFAACTAGAIYLIS